jgi:midasin
VIVDFTFQQKVTNVVSLLDNLVKILEVAKTNATQADCMQIVFLISDGRFSEREGAKKWLREAHEKNIFIVFIVVDNPKSRDSILELKDVTYPNGKLVINRYIDNFPFSYYVILRDINKLPDVLADALRQWFELIKSM